VLSKEHSLAFPIRIQFIENWLRVFLYACRKHDDLEVFAHLCYEFLGVRSDVDIDGVQVAIKIDWLLDVGVLDLLKT